MPYAYKTFLLLTLCGFLLGKAEAQITIGGPSCVVAGQNYTYFINGSVPNNTNQSWCVPTTATILQVFGTNVTGSGSCRTGTNATSIVVTFTQGGPISLTTTVGSPPALNVTVVPALVPGTISANSTQTIAYNHTPATITCPAAQFGACSPAYTYQWEQSPDNSSWSAFGGMTGQDLNFGSILLIQKTFYRRKVTETSTGTVRWSDVATVFVNQPFSSVTITPPSQDIWKGDTPGPIGGGNATGGNCGGNYTYVWQSSIDNGNSFQDIGSTNVTTYSPGPLNVTTLYRRKDACAVGEVSFSNAVVVNVYDHLKAGVTNPTSKTISYGTDPGFTFDGSSPTGGRCSGQYGYQWQISTDGVNFTDIPGANTYLGVDPGVLTVTTYIRRKITCAPETDYSNVETITVNPQVFPGTITPSSLTIPVGGNPGTLTADVARGGACGGNFTYQWQQSTDGSTFTDISGAGGQNYTPGVLSASIYYRRKVMCGIDIGYTNICAINVTNSPVSALNYVQERDLTRPGVTDGTLAASLTDPFDVKQSTKYFDGFGRIVQSVERQETPLGKDWVTLSGYDIYGREPAKFMPYAAASSDGGFKTNGFNEQSSFNATQFAGEQTFYGRTDIEPSPLARVLAAYSPGNNWAGSDRGNTFNDWSNTAVDGVRIWTVTDVAGAFGTYATTATYSPGMLFKHVTTGENGLQMIEFDDLDGRLILKKAQLTATADDGTGRDYNGWLSTYYIYDLAGNLRAVIQPAGVALLAAHNWDLSYQSGVLLTEQCFRFEYDWRNRMIMKQVPGAGPMYTVYDMRDRPVFTQDANQRPNQQWLSTQYDALDRPVVTGLINYSGTLAQLQQVVTTQTTVQILPGISPTLSFSTPNMTGAYQASVSITLGDGFSTLSGGNFSATIVYGGTTLNPNYSSIPSGLTVQPLTVTYYDNYDWIAGESASLSASMDVSNASNGSYFFTSYASYPTYAVAVAPFSQTKGLKTGFKSLVLDGGSQYLYDVNFYDDRGRIVQVENLNYTGGKTLTTHQYDFSGNLLRSLYQQQKNGTNSQSHTLLAKMSYDAMGRVLTTTRTISSVIGGQTYSVPEQTISSLQYNELGKMKNKGLGNSIENLAYDYNVRGWLTSINKNYLTPTGSSNYFGLELSYDKTASVSGTTYASAQFNGNIAGIIWKGAGDGIGRKYDFSYDGINRLTGADFNQQYGSVWQKTDSNSSSFKMDFSVSNLGYDANGNITSMTQQGFKLGSSSPIDVLSYQYQSSNASNKLASVADAANDPNSTLGDFHFKGTKQPTDYSYDANGNLTMDNNKGITSITYNFLNQTQSVTIPGKGTITYTYDATGVKLAKTVVDNTLTPAVTNKTVYLGDAVYLNDQLQFIGHGEGRVRWAFHKYLNGTSAYGYEYDYFLKDHLGNTRVVLTQQKDSAQYMATMETANRTTEDALFYNIDAAAYPVSSIPGTYPTDNTTSPNNYVAKVNGTLQKVGPAIILKVMAGDQFDLVVKSFYHGGGTVSSPNSYFTDILSSLATGIVSVTGGSHGSFADFNNPTGPLAGALNGFSSNKDVTPSDRPKAYLNWIVLDEQFKLASSKAYLVGAAENLVTLGETGITVPKSGYLYIWVSNETPGWDVFFDNLSIKTYSGPLLEETHYYPFGLTMAGISDKALKPQYKENKYRYNGKELQNQEFSDGTGLEEYDYGARFQDPQIGRWTTMDPKADKFAPSSPYAYTVDNPVMLNDPDGKDWEIYSTTDSKTGQVTWHIIVHASVVNQSGKQINMAKYIENQKAAFARLFSSSNKDFKVEASLDLREINVASAAKVKDHLILIEDEKKFGEKEAGRTGLGGLKIEINSKYIDGEGETKLSGALSHEVGHSGGLVDAHDAFPWIRFEGDWTFTSKHDQQNGIDPVKNFMAYPDRDKTLDGKALDEIYKNPGPATTNQLKAIKQYFDDKHLNKDNRYD